MKISIFSFSLASSSLLKYKGLHIQRKKTWLKSTEIEKCNRKIRMKTKEKKRYAMFVYSYVRSYKKTDVKSSEGQWTTQLNNNKQQELIHS